ncbi:MAG: TRAP transporter small permease [Deltaproteobacteria bacterium]|nr:TRAP transporter small permease [Deltaproteobacteria bacterium]MBW2154076.1 TRAP transporter small permease [Deltaproteobacteria bacterium]
MKALYILDSYLSIVRKLLYYIIVLMFGSQVLVVFSQVIWRFVFSDPFSWSEELARYLQVWMVLLTSSVCIREDSHLTVDYAIHNLPFKIKKVLKLIVLIVIMCFLIIVIVYGSKMIMVTKYQITPAMQLPIYVVYFSFPVAGFLMLLEALILFFKIIKTNSLIDLSSICSKG